MEYLSIFRIQSMICWYSKTLKFQEAMFLLTYACMFLASGALVIDHYRNTDNTRAKAMGSIAIIAGGLMGVDFISIFVQIIH